MEHEVVDDRLLMPRTAKEREPTLHRLRRIEGQVRGLHQLIEQDRYCLDEIQQANATYAVTREVIVLISGQHLAAGAEHVAQGSNITKVLEDMNMAGA